MKRFRHLYIYTLLRGFLVFFKIIPRGLALSLGKLIGVIVFKFSKEARRVSFENLRFLYPSVKSPGQKRNLVINNFKEVGKNLIDMLRLTKYRNGTLDRIVALKNGNNIRKLMDRGKGLIVITAHLGCWELIPAFFSQNDYTVNVIAREVYDKNVNREVNRIRECFNIRIIDKARAPIVALKRLLRGEGVGILMDQNTKTNSVSIDFLGHKANTPIGPAYLALKTGAPVLPVAIHRLKDDSHLIEVGEEVSISRSGDFETDLFENTQRFSKAIERFIVNHPEEWVWFHKRWDHT
jgi:KDO2-lipid IV(A) lauroyltransferase